MPVTFQVVGNLADFGNDARAGVKVRATASPGIKVGSVAVHSNQPETVVTDADGSFALELVSLPGVWYRIQTPYGGALPTINLAGYVPDPDDPTTGTAFPEGTVIDVKDVADENPAPGYEAVVFGGNATWEGLPDKPELADVATSGDYADLTGAPTLAPVATSGTYSDLTGKPTLSMVAATGAYTDLSGKPTLGTAAATAATDYATAAQGALAGTAVQPAALAAETTARTTALATKADTTSLVAAIRTGTLTPAGSLTFTAHPTKATFVPMSIGSDGVAYGRTGGGLFAERLNTAGTAGDGFVDFSGKAEHSGGGKVRWATRTPAGYVVVTVVGSTTYVWYSTTWGPLSSFTLKATIPFVALDALGIPNPFIARDGSTYLFVVVWNGAATVKPVWASFDGGVTWAKIKDGATAVDGGVTNHWHCVAYHARWSRIWLSGGDGVNSWFGYSDNKGVTWHDVPTAADSPVYDGVTYQQPTAIIPFEDRVFLGPDRGSIGMPPGLWEMDPATGRTAPKFIIDATVTSPDKQYPVAPYAISGNEAYVAFPASSSMPVGTRNHTDIAATGDGGRSWHKVATISWNAADLSGNGIVGPDNNGYLYHVGSAGLTRAPRLSWTVTP